MQDHDALILPSIIEGRALVQQEALSCGLPIITTPNAGGADLIEEGMTGHLVPIRSPEIIAEKNYLACRQQRLFKRPQNTLSAKSQDLHMAKLCEENHRYAFLMRQIHKNSQPSDLVN